MPFASEEVFSAICIGVHGPVIEQEAGEPTVGESHVTEDDAWRFREPSPMFFAFAVSVGPFEPWAMEAVNTV